MQGNKYSQQIQRRAFQFHWQVMHGVPSKQSMKFLIIQHIGIEPQII